ncbi:MAG: aminoacyl-tRNA deacylase [Bacteroidetes bacterium]|nr:aminoacyl-tRNA deacylase [Bacteroidota bacterium]
MKKEEIPVTPAVRVLRQKQIPFIPHMIKYEEHGGTKLAAELIGVPEGCVVKTLVMETDQKKPLIILMHGNCEVSTKQMARILGVKQILPCEANAAMRYTGYQFGGTSPFGTRHTLPVYAEKSILEMDRIFINGGKRGFIIEISPKDLKLAFPVIEVNAAVVPQ